MGNQRAGDVYNQRPRNAFVRKDIYTKRPYHEDGTPGYEYEHLLSGIEHNAAPVIDKVVTAARRQEQPELSPREKADFQRFVFALARRTPESQTRVAQGLTSDDYYDIFRAHAEKNGFAWSLGRDAFHAHAGMTKYIERLQHNINATFAAGDDPRMAVEEKRFATETEVRFVVIHGSEDSFVIGSHGITICKPVSVSPFLAGTVLPLAYDVLAHVTSRPRRTGLLFLGNDRPSMSLIHAVNRTTASQSETIAGRSQDLIRSLLQ